MGHCLHRGEQVMEWMLDWGRGRVRIFGGKTGLVRTLRGI